MIGLHLDFLLDTKQLIYPGKSDCITWDFFISAYNDSDRVKEVFSKINSNQKFWFIHSEYNYKVDQLPPGLLLPYPCTGSEDDVIISAFDSVLSSLHSESRICIDVTGMMRPHILFLLFYLKNRGIFSFDLIYTEPKHYRYYFCF